MTTQSVAKVTKRYQRKCNQDKWSYNVCIFFKIEPFRNSALVNAINIYN